MGGSSECRTSIAVVAFIAVLAAVAGAALILLEDESQGSSDLVITEAGVYKGNTYENILISPEVGDGEVTLVGFNVTDTLTVMGGGGHTVELRGCRIAKAVIDKDGGEPVHLEAVGSRIDGIIADSDCVLGADKDSQIGFLEATGSDVTLQGGETMVKRFLARDGSSLTIDKEKISVGTLDISGKCTIDVGNGSIGALNALDGSSVTLSATANGEIGAVCYGDGVSFTLPDAVSDQRLMSAEQRFSDSNESRTFQHNGPR